MAASKKASVTRERRDSTESTLSMWEKFSEQPSEQKQEAPFGNFDTNDSNDDNCALNDDDDDQDQINSSLDQLHIDDNQHSLPWENPTKQEHLKVIVNYEIDIKKIKKKLMNEFSKLGLNIKNEIDNQHQWHFGLIAIEFTLNRPQIYDIQKLRSCSSIPYWITLKKQQNLPMATPQNKSAKYFLRSNFSIVLDYGALVNLNRYLYSPNHSWKNFSGQTDNDPPDWTLYINDQPNRESTIDWIIRNTNTPLKIQLALNNIHHTVIVDASNENFDIYICQKCNTNEYEKTLSANLTNNNDRSRHSFPTNNPSSSHRSKSRPTRPPPLVPAEVKPRFTRKKSFGPFKRKGVAAGCYFPTIRFSLRINTNSLGNKEKTFSQKRQILSSFIEYFLSHKISVCYGTIQASEGSIPYLFFQRTMPQFPSLIMKYGYQLLSSVGYRLQMQMDQEFLDCLLKESNSDKNPEELIYRVCVYLSRIFSLKPFVDIKEELHHALFELKRKRDHEAYGLVKKITSDEENEAYIPSVTLTPTTIRVKPLKLCRANRVIRETKMFGKPHHSFVLVDIRDENGRFLRGIHCRDLHDILINYLNEGFALMDDDRKYKYLHHSQSQLRERQFWFYHHHESKSSEEKINATSDEAYEWMGDFSSEKNPAKYAARMALCFTTTTPTVDVPNNKITVVNDIMTFDGRFAFTDGCGTMSIALRDEIKESMGIRRDFSAVQFRYDGAKGVVSVDPNLSGPICLKLRKSMKKFDSLHTCFEVCKLSAPRSTHLNRQAILLLNYRKIPDSSFIILQQQNHLTLIYSLLRNSDAQKLILEKIPRWLLPEDMHKVNLDYIHEPFFRQLLISSCLQSMNDLLRRTRIRVPHDKGRNMFGIVDEYNVLKPHEVFIQYTRLSDDITNKGNGKNKTKILDNCQVVITKNPCYHPGDIRTFTAVRHPKLEHLKDVVVFSQQGNRPAPHDISGSDLDGDEYLVVWHEDLVPYETPNAAPLDYDSEIPSKEFSTPISRKTIHNTVLELAEEDYLGRLSNLHLVFADKYGVDNENKLGKSPLSTVELAFKISQEVDSGKTGYHPVTNDDIRQLNVALGNERPDFMDNQNYKQYKSNQILGKLFRASARMLPGWKKLVRYHRHLRHLQIRIHDEPQEDEDEQIPTDDVNQEEVNIDESLLGHVDRQHQAYKECAELANHLAFVYRQEILEIITLYGLSHESDLWARNSINNLSGELEDTAYTELEQLVVRTRFRFFMEYVRYCETGQCSQDTPWSDLCKTCRKRQESVVVACYIACYNVDHKSEQAPILSLPWLFATPLLQNRLKNNTKTGECSLILAMHKALFNLILTKHVLRLKSLDLEFETSTNQVIDNANVDISVAQFIEVIEECIGSKKLPKWPLVLSRFVRQTSSFKLISKQSSPNDEWKLILKRHKITEDDDYAASLISTEQTEEEDTLMHDYFKEILDICFDEGRQNNDLDFLDISEQIILLLQKMAINETII